MHIKTLTVAVAGCSIQLAAEAAPELEQLRSLLAAAPLIDGTADITITVGAVARPRRRFDRRVQHVAWWYEGTDSIIATSPDQTARVSGDRAMLDPGTAGRQGLHTLVFPVLSELLSAQGLCVVHAAAFQHGSSAVLALGGSGQGKSSLVTATLAAGHPVLSDDMVALRRDAGGTAIAGIPQPLALPADLAGEPSVGTAIVGDPRDRRSPAAGIQLDTAWHPLAVVLVVQHSDEDEGSLQVADPREVFHWALSSSWEGTAVGRARRALPFAAAVSRVPAWHLGHARDATLRVKAANRHVDEAVRLAQLNAQPAD